MSAIICFPTKSSDNSFMHRDYVYKETLKFISVKKYKKSCDLKNIFCCNGPDTSSLLW